MQLINWNCQSKFPLVLFFALVSNYLILNALCNAASLSDPLALSTSTSTSTKITTTTNAANPKPVVSPIIAINNIGSQSDLNDGSNPSSVSHLSGLSTVPAESNHQSPPVTSGGQKLKRDSRAKVTSLELDTQETGYLPTGYQNTDSDYGYDSGKNAYGKQASDWSLYDQGNHGLYDKYGDKAWKDQGHNAQSSHGKHDSYGNSYNSHGSGHGSGYYSRDRGYGYEKHYAYDKEVASKHHADNHNNYGNNHGLHDNYGNSASNSHSHLGHDKYGQLSRYGNHGYGKRASNLATNQDYGNNQNKGHYYSQSYPSSYPSYSSSHVPTYRSTYSDYGPQVGYPNSYPSYY